MPQVAETDQEANTLSDHVTDMRVPVKVAVKNQTQVFHSPTLLNGLPTDPHADWG